MDTSAKSILVVEDEPSLLKLLKEMYQSKGFNVLSAIDGAEGIKIALKEHPDLIVLDLLLPKLGGIPYLKKLRQDNWGKTAKVIVLTNLSNNQSVADALELGVQTYIVKSDMDIENVINKTRQELGQ